MKNLTFYSFFFIFISFIIGCRNEHSAVSENKKETFSFDLNTAKTEIEKKNAAFAKAFTTGDSAGMVNNYTKDGKLFPPNAEAAIGSAAIGKLVSQYMKFGIKEFRDDITSLYGDEANLIEEGTYFMGDGKGNTIDKGKYIEVWRRVNGEWKISSDIFNSSLPPGPCK